MRLLTRRIATTSLALVALAGAFWAGTAYAADARLAAADQAAEKAIALLQAAENPNVKPPFGGHRAKAIAHMKIARAEIAKAIKYADNPPKPKPKPKKPHHWGKKKHDKKK